MPYVVVKVRRKDIQNKVFDRIVKVVCCADTHEEASQICHYLNRNIRPEPRYFYYSTYVPFRGMNGGWRLLR